MKTIFISGFHPLILRNTLAPTLGLLLERPDIRIVLLVPAGKADYFAKEFGGPRVLVFGTTLGGGTRSRRDRAFESMAWAMLGSGFTRIMYRARLQRQGRWFQYLFFYLPLRILGRSRLFLAFFRKIDFHVSPANRFAAAFDTHRPDLIFAADIKDKYDVELIHAARRRNVPVVGMVRSWDNLTKFGLVRAIPDVLFLWNELMQKEAVRYHGIRPDVIRVVGIPHYDAYISARRLSREDFCRSIGADPRKPILFFSPLGAPRLAAMHADRGVLNILSEFDAMVVVRMPPTNPVDLGQVLPPNVIVDEPGVLFERRAKIIDRVLTAADDRRLIAELASSDVVVCGPTTIAVDAAVLDRPTILFNFHSGPGPLLDETYESYDSDHMRYVLERGAARLVHSTEELRSWIRRYLAEPSLDRAGRHTLAQDQAWRLDGHSSQRVVREILALLPEGAKNGRELQKSIREQFPNREHA